MASKTCLATAFALVSLFLGWLCAWGMFLQRPCHRGSHSPCPNVCGGLEGREAGRGSTSWGHYSTSVRNLQWGGGITWKEGLVLACVLLQRRVRLGLRRYPARSAPFTLLGVGRGRRLLTWHVGTRFPAKPHKAKSLHSLDSIDPENSGTRGRSILVHSRLLDSSVPAGEDGAVGNGVERSLGTEPG